MSKSQLDISASAPVPIDAAKHIKTQTLLDAVKHIKEHPSTANQYAIMGFLRYCSTAIIYKCSTCSVAKFRAISPGIQIYLLKKILL